eukprot:NODE_4052_length_715_cov_333.422727.p1 GENE.NODE_4052_length_715_cov_333.422727~~NODE_4052_length_715_cov_333.422727.p1  ORF type:complete len:199 (-),score=36.50 NODE_4052_length_715_cov_333.422727:117-656(-)
MAMNHAVELRGEVARAEARNAELEKESEALHSEHSSAEHRVSVAEQTLENRRQALAALRGAMKEHAMHVRERVSMIERSIEQPPATQDLIGDATWHSEAPTGNKRELPPRTQGCPEEPTLSYPPAGATAGGGAAAGYSLGNHRPASVSSLLAVSRDGGAVKRPRHHDLHDNDGGRGCFP